MSLHSCCAYDGISRKAMEHELRTFPRHPLWCSSTVCKVVARASSSFVRQQCSNTRHVSQAEGVGGDSQPCSVLGLRPALRALQQEIREDSEECTRRHDVFRPFILPRGLSSRCVCLPRGSCGSLPMQMPLFLAPRCCFPCCAANFAPWRPSSVSHPSAQLQVLRDVTSARWCAASG